MTPSYLLAFPALSQAPSISIPPSSPTPFQSQAQGFICLRSLPCQSVEIRGEHKPAWSEEKGREKRDGGKKKEKKTEDGTERERERERERESKREDRDNKSSMGPIASHCVCEAAGNKRGENSLRSLGFHTDKQHTHTHTHTAADLQ